MITDTIRDLFLYAILHKDSGTLEFLLSQHDELKDFEFFGFKSLSLAALLGCSDIVDVLIKFNAANVNEINNNGITPLFIACYMGHNEFVAKLVEAKVNVNQVLFADGSTALKCACYVGNDKIVEILLKAGAVVDQCVYSGHESPLVIAAVLGNLKIVQQLCICLRGHLEYKCLNEALKLAALKKHVDIVNYLEGAEDQIEDPCLVKQMRFEREGLVQSVKENTEELEMEMEKHSLKLIEFKAKLDVLLRQYEPAVVQKLQADDVGPNPQLFKPT